MAGNAAFGGEGQAKVSPVTASAMTARCRRPPTTSDAWAISVRATGDKPSSPSSPIPMSESPRRPPPNEGPFPEQTEATPNPGRQDGGKRPRPAARGTQGSRPDLFPRRPNAHPRSTADTVPYRRIRRYSGTQDLSDRRED